MAALADIIIGLMAAGAAVVLIDSALRGRDAWRKIEGELDE